MPTTARVTAKFIRLEQDQDRGVSNASQAPQKCSWRHKPFLNVAFQLSGMGGIAALSFAELLDPFGEDVVAGGFDVDEFDAHANTRLDDAYYSEAFYGLPLSGESDARA